MQTITNQDTATTNDKLGLGLNDGETARVTKEAKLGVVGAASAQWWKRPNDQRYLDLDSLREAVAARREKSRDMIALVENLAVKVDGNGKDLVIYDEKQGTSAPGARLTHNSFGQIAQLAGAGRASTWLRQLGEWNMEELAAINLNAALAHADRGDTKLLLTRDDKPGSSTPTQLRAANGPGYGRIWDVELVDAIRAKIGPEWKIPAASYATQDPKRASTLYASDRDVFIFLVDDSHPIEVPGEPGHQMFRGFYAWNSETGSQSLGLATFLYDYVCDNRNIWNVRDFAELRIRHSAGAPQRFVEQAKPALDKYLNASTASTIEVIKRAQAFDLGKDVKSVKEKLAAKGFTKGVITSALDYAEAVPGNPLSLWNIEQGLTAAAREISHTDARLDVEEKAGQLMAAVL